MAETPLFDCNDEGVESARQRYFEPGRAASWESPGRNFVSGKLAWFIRRRGRGNWHDCEEVFQEVYVNLWARFAQIVEKFQCSGRGQTVENFERYFHQTILNRVISEFRKRAGLPEPGPEIEGSCEPAEADSERAKALRTWQVEVLESLPEIDSTLLARRLVDEESCANLAAELGMTRTQVYKTLCNAKRRFRNGMIERVAQYHFSQRPTEAAQFEALIRHRCARGHPCYMFRIVCPAARTLHELARMGVAQNEAEVAESLRVFEQVVRTLLDDWDLQADLDQCAWAG